MQQNLLHYQPCQQRHEQLGINIMQTQFIALASQDYEYGEDLGAGQTVINVSPEFPENGFSYDDMREGKCKAYVWVTCEIESNA